MNSVAGDRPAIRGLVAHTVGWDASRQPLRSAAPQATRGTACWRPACSRRAGTACWHPACEPGVVFPTSIKGEHTRWPQDRLIMAVPPLAA